MIMESRKSRRRKAGSPAGKAGRLFLFLFVLAVVLLAAGYAWSVREMTERARYFMELVTAGDTRGAAALLEERDPSLEGLIGLFQETDITYTQVDTGRLTGLFTGTVTFHLTSQGVSFTENLSLVRRDGRWLVDSFPAVELLTGAFVVREEPGSLLLLWNREERRLNLARPLGLGLGMVIEARILGGTVIAAHMLEEKTVSRLLVRSAAELDGELEGPFAVGERLQVFILEADRARPGSPADLIPGRRDITLHFAGGEVAAATVRGRFKPDNIRVVLNDSDYQSLLHKSLRLRGTATFTVEVKRDEARYTFSAGDVLVVEPVEEGVRLTQPEGDFDLTLAERVYVRAQAGSRLLIENLRRVGWEGQPPAYRGVLEIVNREGQLVVVNELPLEHYLYAVVPSEMPLTYGEEPLKAQAVAARSYAYASMLDSGYSSYGAHVDDSTLSQVYNSVPESAASSDLVDATRGLVVFFEEGVADTRFFSTSCGYTACCHQVWHNPADGSFPGRPVAYLQARSQIPGESPPLNDEEQVRKFLERSDWDAFDRASPYFRWKVEMSRQEMEAAISRNLPERYAAEPSFVLTRAGEDFVSRELPAEPLGELRAIRVVERGEGGNIMVLEIEGSAGTYRIIKEYNIRTVLRPVQYLPGGKAIALQRHDGSKVENYSLLPSAFAVFDLLRDEQGRVQKVTILGGGNGHGVGLSQQGARGMANRGSDFKGILEHYYPGTHLKNIYD